MAASDPTPGVGETLAKQGMPVEEVRTVLHADDPSIVRRHLELHRERLDEQLETQRRAVDDVERLLVGAIRRPGTSQRATRPRS